jgi:hypothetical protein
MRTNLRNLCASDRPRNPRRSSTRLRPTLLALEERWLLSNFVVDNPTDTPVSGQIDLRQAIEAANDAGGKNTISFSPLFNTPQTIALSGRQLEITDYGLKIDGPANGVTVLGIGGDGLRQSRVFFVAKDAHAVISNLTVELGYESRGYGGGVYNRGSLFLRNCTITHNQAHTKFDNNYGGGLYNDDGRLTLWYCTVSFNDVEVGGGFFSTAYGGGVANYHGTVNLIDCTVDNNSAGIEGSTQLGGGGGLYNYGKANLTNCTFSDNVAAYGGGMKNHGDAELVSCTFASNNALFGGGMYLSSSLVMWNTIVADNIAAGGFDSCPDVDGHVLSGGRDNPNGGYNMISDSSGSWGWGDNDIVFASKPDLLPLGQNGGPTRTVALDSGSPAINNGTYVDYAGTNSPLTNDQRGSPLDTPKPDIGAFQVQRG